MLINLILYGCCIIIIPIMYFVLKANIITKNNLVMGVIIPIEHLKDEAIETVIKDFKRSILILSVILALIPIPASFIKSFAIGYTVWCLWLTFSIIGYMFPYNSAHKKIRQIKAAQHFSSGSSGDVITIDTRVAADKEAYLYHPWFIIITFLSFVPVIWQAFHAAPSEWIDQITGLAGIACVAPALYLISLGLVRMRGEIINADSTVNANFNRAKYRMWNRVLLLIAYLDLPIIWVLWAYYAELLKSVTVLLIIMPVLYILLAIYMISSYRKIKKLRAEYSDDNYGTMAEDDEKHWIWGAIYYNPNDNHVMVEKRFGMGTTINIASKPGKLLIIFTLICLLMLPASGVLIGVEEYTPIKLTYENQQLTSDHVFTHYHIAASDISKLELLTSLPQRSRRNGTGMDMLQKGHYEVAGYGSCRLCLNPKLHNFLLITSSDGSTYILSAESDTDTLAIYDAVNTALK